MEARQLHRDAFLVRNVDIEFTLSSPYMKRFGFKIRLNDDATTYLQTADGCRTNQQTLRMATTFEDVLQGVSELLCISAYPLPTCIDVPFKLRDYAVLKKKALEHNTRNNYLAE